MLAVAANGLAMELVVLAIQVNDISANYQASPTEHGGRMGRSWPPAP